MECSTQNSENGICEIHSRATNSANTNNDDSIITTNSENKRQETATNSSTSRRSSKRNNKSFPESSIVTLHGKQDFDAFASTNSAVIIEFVTSWCGACKGIEEYYEESATSHIDVVHSARVVCDKNKQTKKLAAEHKVNSYPVFIAFKDGVIVNRWDGADRGKLESTYERLGGGRKKGKGRSKRR